MTTRDHLEQLLGRDVVVTHPQHGIVARGKLAALADHPTVIVNYSDGRQGSWPQHFQVTPDLTADARRVIAELERYEDEHGHHDDGWPCLASALEAARSALAAPNPRADS